VRVDHVGVVVKDLERALDSYAAVLDLPPEARTVSTVVDPESGEDIDVGFLRIGANRLEFICPRPGSVSRFAEHLNRHGEGIYHISVYVDEFGAAIDRLRGNGVAIEPFTVVMSPPAAPAPASAPADADAPAHADAPKRVVDIAWVPTSLTCGVNLELVDGRAR